jgi:hypothetical protein
MTELTQAPSFSGISEFKPEKIHGNSFILLNYCIENPAVFMKRNERLRGKSTKTLAMCTDHLPKIEGAQKLLTFVRRMGTLL